MGIGQRYNRKFAEVMYSEMANADLEKYHKVQSSGPEGQQGRYIYISMIRGRPDPLAPDGVRIIMYCRWSLYHHCRCLVMTGVFCYVVMGRVM